MTQHMSQDPDPATTGNPVKIKYDIDGVSLPITLSGRWDPDGPDFEHTIASATDNEFTVTPPRGATGGNVEDDSGQSDSFDVMVSP